MKEKTGMKGKNVLIVILAMLLAFGSVFAASACDKLGHGTSDEEMYTYYGCPNSGRVKKLNLVKKLWKK